MPWLWPASLTLCIGLSLFAVANLEARSGDEGSSPDATPLREGDAEAIGASLEAEGAVAYASARVDRAVRHSLDALGCTLLNHGLASAREAFERGAHRQAALLSRAILERGTSVECPETSNAIVSGVRGPRRPTSESGSETSSLPNREDKLAMARLLRGHALLETDRPERALELFERVDATPIDDRVQWFRARAHEALGAFERAASLYAHVYDVSSTPLRFRARARQIASLVEAKRWEDALPALEEMLETFPDYPRRARLLYQRGRALEALGRFEAAVESYREAWLNFPHKPAGDHALARLDTLRLRGVDAPAPSMERLFDHYSDLRRHKHWELAETLLQNLLERAKKAGDRQLAHRILMQLGLNAYIPKHNREALDYFRRLERAWAEGRRRGIDIDSVREYLGRTHGRLGHIDRAARLLERAFEDEGAYERRREMAEFFMGLGQFEKARKLFDSYYPEWRKRRWLYTWLLYKTGRYEEAYDHLRHIARHHHGRREARALYWAARTREHQDEPKEAAALFKRVAEDEPYTYYGFQAENRLMDLRQRRSVDGAIARRTRSLVGSSDRVLDALDNAADAIEGRGESRAAIDPTMLPKRASGSESSELASRCRTGQMADSQFCHLLSGRIPDPTLRVLERALSPGYSPRSLRSGSLHAFHIRPNRSSNEGESTVAPEAANGADRGDETSSESSRSTSTIAYNTEARIYWEGRHDSEVAFVRYANGEAIGPVPERPFAYATHEHAGGVSRAVAAASELFPMLERVQWLRNVGLQGAARDAMRDVALEFEGLVERGMPSESDPHELPHRRWTYLIDHRRGHQGYWGYRGEETKRYPIPEGADERRELARRQQRIVERAERLRPILTEAMMEVGEYHLVRQWTLDHASGWYERSPDGPAQTHWTRAYPRAFPDLVLSEARDHGLNPYLLWSLMAVESAYNPDSISYAEAIGLLQVIPRTGIKVAEWLGDEDFGPYDLVEPEVAIQQGTSYLGSLVDKFHHQELFAVAGYNGGPHRVAIWLDRRGEMPFDEFVETIPFTQTRRYVKKVTRYLGIYMRLYEGRNSLYIGQNIDATYRPKPNF